MRPDDDLWRSEVPPNNDSKVTSTPFRDAFVAVVLLPCLMAMTLGSLHPSSARADTVRARYKIGYLGLTVGDLSTVSMIGPSAYQVDLDAGVAGIATVASNIKVNMKSGGSLRKGQILPGNFAASHAKSSADVQTMRLMLNAGDVVSVDVEARSAEGRDRRDRPIPAKRRRAFHRVRG
jgi:hypothetical protein